MEIEDNGGKYWDRNWEGKRREERKETVMGKCPLYPGYASMSAAGVQGGELLLQACRCVALVVRR